MSRVAVTEFRRNAREFIRIAWDEFEGNRYLDLRTFYEDGPDLKPSKKGLTLRADQIDTMIEALQMAKAMQDTPGAQKAA